MDLTNSAASRPWEECLRRVSRRWGLRYLVLFGSQAGNYPSPHSDVDVAVKVGGSLGLGDRGLLQGELEQCVGRAVDLVFIDDWSPIIAWEALARGRLVYACNHQCVKEYYEDLAKAIDEVSDIEPLLDLFRRESRSALARLSGEDKQG